MTKLFSFFLVLFSMLQFDAQKSINLGLCDTLPHLFYYRNYESIEIENGMGYCMSPVKLLDERIVHFKNLKSLNFIHSQYQLPEIPYVLPVEIKNLNKVESVYTNIPNAEIFSMKSLKKLSIFVQSKQTLDFLTNEGFQNLTNLEELYLNFGGNTPGEYNISGIAKLKNLRKVYLSRPNQQLVDEVLSNENLESLEVTYTKGIHFDFSKVKKLKTLKLRDNNLSEFPTTVFHLKQLEELIISYNSISFIPEQINQFDSLRYLDLNSNQINALPDEITHCGKLKVLILSNNRKLNYLPENLGELKYLERIQISQCNLTYFPPSVKNCTNLISIGLSKNKLNELNLDFSNLLKLETIFLSDNQLKTVPNSLFELPLVIKLDITNNQLIEVPKSIGKMNKLEELRLYKNQITELPDDIGELKNIEVISVYNNKLKSIPASIVELKKLRQLHTGDNLITHFPPNLKKLGNLQDLELYGNPLKIFPIEVYELKSIWGIWVSKEQTKLSGYRATKEHPQMIITR